MVHTRVNPFAVRLVFHCMPHVLRNSLDNVVKKLRHYLFILGIECVLVA